MYGVDISNAMPIASAGLATVSLQLSQDFLSIGVLLFALLALVTTVRSLAARGRGARRTPAPDSVIIEALFSVLDRVRSTQGARRRPIG